MSSAEPKSPRVKIRLSDGNFKWQSLQRSSSGSIDVCDGIIWRSLGGHFQMCREQKASIPPGRITGKKGGSPVAALLCSRTSSSSLCSKLSNDAKTREKILIAFLLAAKPINQNIPNLFWVFNPHFSHLVLFYSGSACPPVPQSFVWIYSRPKFS